MLMASVGIAGASIIFGIEFWNEQERKRLAWEKIVDEFKNCSMHTALYVMGYRSSAHSDSLGDAVSEVVAELRSLQRGISLDEAMFEVVTKANPVIELLTSGIKDGQIQDIDQIWLDPSIPYSVSNEKRASASSINLLSQCESRISDGKLNTWLDVGIYYLIVGHPKAIEWLTKAGEAGIADAYVLLGHAYRLKLISPIKDEKQAFIYYVKAARMGSPKGQLYVAELVRTVNPSQARRYLIAAAEGGSRTATYQLQESRGLNSPTLSDHSSAQQALKSAYFWSLIFDYFVSQEKKMALDAVYVETRDQDNSGSLVEMPDDFAFDGLPTTPWSGYKKHSGALNSAVASHRRIVSNYDPQSAKMNLSRLEAQLDTDSRIAVQGAVKKWIEARVEQVNDQPRFKQAELKAPNSEKLPAWRSLPLAVCEANTASREQSGSELFKSFKPYIWTVTAKRKAPNDGALGTAVAVTPSILATNCHVISGAAEITLTQEREKYQATIVAADIKRDLCLLEVKGKLPFVGNAMPLTKIDIGSAAYAIGNPQGLSLTFSNGIISGIRHVAGRDFIQTTAPISRGSSGGALIDDKGNLLGITTFYLQGGQAMNFAIPIEAFCKP